MIPFKQFYREFVVFGRLPDESAADLRTRLDARLAMALKLLFAVGMFGAVLWWPMDSVLFAGDSGIRTVFGNMRMAVIAECLVLWLVLNQLIKSGKGTKWFIYAGVVLLGGTPGYAMGLLGGADSIWIHSQFVAPAIVMVMPLPFWYRVRVSFLTTAADFGAFFVVSGTPVMSPGGLYLISYAVFCTLVCIALGHLVFYQTRLIILQRIKLVEHNKNLQRDVDKQITAVMMLANRVQDIRETERKNIAAELHDGLGQYLSGLRLNLDWLHKVGKVTPKIVGEFYQETTTILEDLSSTIREISQNLRPAALDRLGLVAAIGALLARITSRSNIATWLDASKEWADLDAYRGMILYRIVQEAINNTAGHANAHNVHIRLSATETMYLAEIVDDGHGFVQTGTPCQAGDSGFGILSMHERATALNGRLEIHSDRGTQIALRFPRKIGETA